MSTAILHHRVSGPGREVAAELGHPKWHDKTRTIAARFGVSVKALRLRLKELGIRFVGTPLSRYHQLPTPKLVEELFPPPKVTVVFSQVQRTTVLGNGLR